MAIFVNYRREDSESITGRLDDRLRAARDALEPGGCEPSASGGSAGTGGVAGAGGVTQAGGSGGVSVGGAGSGGEPAAGGGAGEAAGGSGSAPSASFTPVCTTTAAGVPIYKGLGCTDKDPQFCWWECGPLGTGFRSETCTSGAYVESRCVFPTDLDYSCFKVPLADAPGCPAGVPQANQPCDIATCELPCSGTACEMCGVAGGYRDSVGTAKVGYCMCVAGSKGNYWSCASTDAWPCPNAGGCQ